MISESIANAFEEEKNLVKICSVSDLTMCVKIQELASDATRQERSLQFGEESKMESMAFAAGNKGLFLLPDAVPHPPPLQILP